MITIENVKEGRRGCGYRKPGGLYLRCDGTGRECGRLPIPLTVCPCCHAGIKPARSWTWVDGDALAAQHPCMADSCNSCALSVPMGKVGLLWIGEQFYPTPEDFIEECDRMGISRRITQVPKEFVVGKTWVWLAHRKCIPGPEPEEFMAGVFRIFRPDRIEYVVKEDDEMDKLEALSDRGIKLVNVMPVDPVEFFTSADDALSDLLEGEGGE